MTYVFSEIGFDVDSDIHVCVHDYVCMMEFFQTDSNDSMGTKVYLCFANAGRAFFLPFWIQTMCKTGNHKDFPS